jgi:hypothetical protein
MAVSQPTTSHVLDSQVLLTHQYLAASLEELVYLMACVQVLEVTQTSKEKVAQIKHGNLIIAQSSVGKVSWFCVT